MDKWTISMLEWNSKRSPGEHYDCYSTPLDIIFNVHIPKIRSLYFVTDISCLLKCHNTSSRLFLNRCLSLTTSTWIWMVLCTSALTLMMVMLTSESQKKKYLPTSFIILRLAQAILSLFWLHKYSYEIHVFIYKKKHFIV